MQWLYLVGAVVGTIVPLRFFVAFVIAHGLNARAFVAELFASDASAFFVMDVIVSSLVLWVFIYAEGRRLRMRRLWLYVVCNALVGVSLALPLFLFARQRALADVDGSRRE